MMNRRENALALLRHEPHDHVPNWTTDFCGTGGSRETFENGPPGGGEDGFGCKWMGTVSALGAGVPAPNSAILKDITAWEDVVRFPDLDAFPWEEAAAQQLEKFDPVNQVQEYGMWNAQFLRLTHLMGFEDGMCALYEEPEACRALLGAITDYKIRVAEYAHKYFRPDTICAFDDVATQTSTFMSPEIYRDLIKPEHRRFNEAVRAMGIIPAIHVCGRCEAIVPDLAEEGAEAWEVCQPENDLPGLQKKVGGKLAFLGGFDMRGELAWREQPEEVLRAAARACIDAYAPGGNFGFQGMILYADPRQFARARQILGDECVKYGTNYYRR